MSNMALAFLGVAMVYFCKIYQPSDKNGEVLIVTLDIAKAFDGILYIGLVYKLKEYGIFGEIFELI